MRGLRKTIMVLMVLSLIVVFAAPASAAYRSLSCEVMRAGYDIESGNLELMLRWSTKSDGRIFYVSGATHTEAEMNRILAIAMTAMTNNWYVKANIDWRSPGEILDMTLLPTPVQ